MPKTVVILGAGWAGLPLAHKLLKYTQPKKDIKVILVTPSTHFFWNVAATRGLIPGEIPDQSMFIPIAPGFERYLKGSFELVLGKAQSIDRAESTVAVAGKDGATKSIRYDQLVIATGSRIASNLPLKLLGSYQDTLDAWHELQGQVRAAQRIIVSGSGPTGLEVAGEIAAKYGKGKQVTLISSTAKPLGGDEGVSNSVRDVLCGDLAKLGVNVVSGTRVENAEKVKDGSSWSLKLSNGSALTADLYLPFHGVTVNTSFVPAELLDERANVKQDETFRVVNTENIWAIGDVGNTEAKQLTLTDGQIVHLATALDAVLTGAPEVPEYKPENKTLLFLSLGKKYATGQIGTWRLWGWMVAWVKGRKLFVDTAKDYVDGKKLRHGAL